MRVFPDIEGHDIKPHTDGLGWRKACPECAHRTSDPQNIGDNYQRRMMEFDGESAFYCLHRRTEDDFDRICACYAAMHRLPQVPASSVMKGLLWAPAK
jgi:hypothetical protein